MDDITTTVNTVAPLQNVARCMRAMERVTNRRQHLPGLVGFYGPSGYGKSTAAAYVANKKQAYFVEVKSTWTQGALLKAILAEMGIKPAKLVYEMADQVAQQLALSGRPLIIDEFDHVVRKGYANLVKDIYESSNAPILVIGEEMLESSLANPTTERLHNRFLEWIPAEPANLDDAHHLRRLYSPQLEIEDELMQAVVAASKGQIRRIVVNIDRLEDFANTEGLKRISRADWGNRSFFTGHAAKRRV